MADENTELAPQGIPGSEATETQPPTGPAAPATEGTPEPATQETGTPETPEQLAIRKAHFQEEARKLAERNRQLAESARKSQQKIREYEARYGSLYSEPTVTSPPQSVQPPSAEVPPAVDAFDPQFLSVLEERLGNVVENKMVRVRQEEQLNAQRANAVMELQNWCSLNKISEELQGEAGRQYANYFRLPNGQVAGTPAGFVWFIEQYIISKMGSDQTEERTAQAIADAAAKAKALPGVAQPAGGQAPSPVAQDQEKKRQEEAANFIAPDSVYGGSG